MTNVYTRIRRTSGASRRMLPVLATLLGTGCAGAPPPDTRTPAADPEALAAEIQAVNAPDSPRRATFTWRLEEAGSRLNGRGVVRYVAPDRLRLDLFGPRGETYLAAALVGDEFRLPPSAREGFSLPSPALLWAALGVVRPPAGAVLETATVDEGTAVLRYRTPEGEAFEFHVTGTEDPRLQGVERIGSSGVLESVRVDRSGAGEVQRTTYRDRAAYRELVLETENVQDVESFPESIWRPDSSR